MARTEYFALRVKIADNEGDDIYKLRVGYHILVLTVQTVKILYAALLKQVKQLELSAGKLRLDDILLTHKAHVYIRIRTREQKQLLGEKQRRLDREGVRLFTENTRNGKPYRIVFLSVNDCHLTALAAAFQLYHISRKRKNSHGADNSRPASGTSVRYGRLLRIQYHILSPIKTHTFIMILCRAVIP